ncbi:hypothetical protein AVEN_181505-1 [Araneus ventricosus]|uniref:Uncharacterized protein n=1 Tax=Araneus ventricosus TaxID=182803 RepID=A0A4Y2F5P2_ARAVE|nr:hypothetical protein AVEN_181505-1 [Araneus ventricosus]
MVELARTGFSPPANQKKKEAANELNNYPTSATLVSTSITNNTDDIVKPFLMWWGEEAKQSDIEIPRHLEINDITQMHVFVDACKEAYATCVFLRTDTSQGVKVVLARAKSR